MIIRELELTGFGRFRDKKITIEEPFNIVEGKNESGKSTLWYFIFGMFYGFFKPNLKVRRYSEFYERFEPWDGGTYQGNIVFEEEKDGRSYRIFRDFRAKQEVVRIFDQQSGHELTENYPMHPIYKLPDVAKVHLQMSHDTFLNTVGVGQLQQALETDFVQEVKATLLKVNSGDQTSSGSGQSSLPLVRAREKLHLKMDEIGNERKKKSPYGKVAGRLEELEEEWEKVHLAERERLGWVARDSKISKDIEEIKKMQQEERRKREASYEKSIKELGLLEDFTYEQVYQLMDDYRKREMSLQRLEEIRIQKKRLSDQHRERQQSLERSRVLYEEEMHSLAKGAQDGRKKGGGFMSKPHAPLVLTGALVGILILVVGVFARQGFLEGLGVLLLMLAFLGWGILERLWGRQILSGQKEKSLMEMSRHDLLRNQLETENSQMEALEEEKEELRQREHRVISEKVSLENGLEPLVKAYGISTLEDFETLLKKYSRQEAIYKKQLQSPEGRNEEHLREALASLEAEKIRLEERMANYDLDHRSLNDVEEEMEFCRRQLDAWEEELSVYNKIEHVLEEVVNQLQRDFAPTLNETLKEMTDYMTEGKYSQVAVDEDLTIRLRDPLYKRPIEVNQLSQGTRDLLYIALRLAIVSWMEKEVTLPLLLDEPFAHMDDARLQKAMGYLKTMKRQVFLFTCQPREAQLVNDIHKIQLD